MTIDREPWKIKKEITVGHILTILPLIGVMIGGYVNIQVQIKDVKTETEINSLEISHVKDLNTLQQKRTDEILNEIKEQFQTLSDKLDTISRRLVK